MLLLRREKGPLASLTLESPLLLSKLDNFLVNEQSLAFADRVHVDFRDVCSVGFFAKVFQFFFCCGDPEGIDIEQFISKGKIQCMSHYNTLGYSPAEDQLWASSAGRPFSDI